MKKIKRKSSYYIAYSAAMTGIFMIILFIFWKNGKSFVRDGDGLRQHYITLEYWGKYLRQIIKELLIHHRLRIPTWDLHIGFKLGVILLTVMVCFPIFGRIMNGFSYTTNRWTWAVPMLLAYIFVKMFPEFFHLSVKKKLLIVAIILIYAAFFIFKVRKTVKHTLLFLTLNTGGLMKNTERFWNK